MATEKVCTQTDINNKNDKNNNNNKLTPYLSPAAAWALSLGTSIGWGSLFITGNTYLPQAGPAGSIIGMVIGAVIMIIMARNYHYMMNIYPDSGGAYTFAKKSFGYDHGFLCSWFLALTYLAMLWANATALPLFANYFLGDFFHFGFHYNVFGYEVYLGEALLSMVSILIIALLCAKTKKGMGIFMVILALSLTVGITICFSSHFFSSESSQFSNKPYFVPDTNPLLQILRIACISPWAFIGFENISHSTEEFKFPRKKTFSVFTVSIISATLLYSFVVLLSISAYPPEYNSWLDYIKDLHNLNGIKGLPPFYAANHYLGSFGTILLLAAMLALILTSLIGNLTALSRLLYAISKDGIIPDRFSKLSKKGIPSNAIWLIAGLSILIPFLGRSAIGWIVDVTTIGATIIYGFISVSAFRLAHSRKDKTECVTGIVGLILMVFFVLYLLVFDMLSANSLEPESYFIFTIWSALGFIFFVWVVKKDKEKKFVRSTVVWIALLVLVLFTSLVWISQSAMSSARHSMEHMKEHYTDESYTQERNDEEEEAFIDNETQELRNSIVKSMGAVILLFGVSMGIQVMLQKKHENLEREKMAAEEGSRAKSRFLFNMSHDIRTPMNAIIGFTHLARKDGISEEDKDKYLVKIENSSQQLLGIINDVLDMSRIENGKMELDPAPMNLDHVLEEMKDLFSAQMESKKIKYTVTSENLEHPWVMCDKNRFTRIPLNLVGNAYKFTNENGRISLIIRETGFSDDKADFELCVKDNGIGMSPEFAEHMFTPFEMERSSTISGIQGTGLGLSITKAIAEMMGGTINVKSEVGKGTEFIVSISFQIAEAIIEKANDNPQDESIDHSKFNILLVEDNAINLEIAKMILGSSGFGLDTAENGKIAFEKVEGSEPYTYDIILMDVQMPVMNGYESAKAIRSLADKKKADIPIIAMTANVFQEDIMTARDAGMDDHIAKPLDVNVMMKTIDNMIVKSMNDGRIAKR